MTAITVTGKNLASFGNVGVVTGTVAKGAIDENYTWPTGLGRVDQLFMQPDLGSTWAWSQSAGTVTFTGAALSDVGPVSLKAIGRV
jgi:hypothetical protein